MVILIRIDDRLIHGQVVEGWVNFLKATCIMVADDAVAANSLQRSIMEMAVPQGLKVQIGPVADICERLRSAVDDKERTILLFSRPGDVVRALREGMQFPAVNIGGMHYTPGKRKLMDVLAVNDADMEAFKEMADQGVKIDLQSVPTQRPVSFERILHVCGSSTGGGK
jgi:PTS system mannose-specific IIB component